MEAAGRLSDVDRKMLILHYDAPRRTLTTRQVSALMGWGGQTANQLYGRLARHVSEQLAWVPADRSDGYYVSVLIVGDRDPQGAFEWRMRPQLAQALELLKWPGLKGSVGSEPTQGTGSITERRRYAWQLRLERDSRAAEFAKAHHGYKCQACLMSFSDMYGDIGAEFIEAHHIVPLSDIEERDYTPDDFAVLCSNCHRMIHRWPDPDKPRPWDIDGFRGMIQARRKKTKLG